MQVSTAYMSPAGNLAAKLKHIVASVQHVEHTAVQGELQLLELVRKLTEAQVMLQHMYNCAEQMHNNAMVLAFPPADTVAREQGEDEDADAEDDMPPIQPPTPQQEQHCN